MKIILSPSKEMAFEKSIDKKIKLNEISQEILDEIQKMSKNDLQKKLKVSDKLADEVYGYYQDLTRVMLIMPSICTRAWPLGKLTLMRLMILLEII